MPTDSKKTKLEQPHMPDSYRVRIRMYRQGLGDCFLLSFPRGGKEFHMLIDCGVVLGTGDPGVVMKQVAENVKKTVNGQLDVLVITHEHWDHLSGFDKNQAGTIFGADDFTIKSLWLAWTEDPASDLANSLRAERERKKVAAREANEALKKRAIGAGSKRKRLGLERRASHLSEVLGFFGGKAVGDDGADDDSGGGTAGALKFLKEKCRATFLETGSCLPLSDIPGVHVYVVGPPMDGDAMRKTNPRKGEAYGLREQPIGLAEAFLSAFNSDDERAQPFDHRLRRPLVDLEKLSVNADANPGLARYYHPETAWRNIDDDWLGSGERLALQLDNATNNTSLVLAIELDEQDVLLFVGDAQAGNWRSWEDRKWRVERKEGGRRTVTAADLLSRTIFYKVGHHGSHNATMRAKGLELMRSDRLAAVIPVDTKVAHTVKGWTHMPLSSLRSRLEEKCGLVFQTDKPTVDKTETPGSTWEESSETFNVRMTDKKTKKMKTVAVRPLYTDYYVV